MAFLYRLLDLIRDREEKINLARFAYVLARLEPKEKEKKRILSGIFKKMYQWSNNEKDSKQLITAIYVYVYLNRKEDKDYDTE